MIKKITININKYLVNINIISIFVTNKYYLL